MSFPSIHRVKERGGGGAKRVAAALPSPTSGHSKPQRTLPKNPHQENIVCKKPAGKEVTRSVSRSISVITPAVGQKSTVRPPLQRIDKLDSGKEGETRIRWSTSSLPKGKSSNHTDFTRRLSDLRQHRVSRVSQSSDEAAKALEKPSVAETIKSDPRFVGDDKRILPLNTVRVLENPKENVVNAVRVLDSKEKAGNIVNMNAVWVLENCMDKASLESKKAAMKVVNGVRVYDEDKGARIVNKNPSKFHEKLSFFEGKAKRIASDIKKTKGMLDMDNPDASKLILSDVQHKISGIEKFRGHANVIEKKGKLSLSERGNGVNGNCLRVQEAVETNGSRLSKSVIEKAIEKNQDSGMSLLKNSVKGLNHEQLEARLFPHHKLLGDRPCLSNLSVKDGSKDQNDLTNVPESNGSRPIDETPIALEFLASLNQTNLPQIDTYNGIVQQEYSAVQEMDSTVCLQAENAATCAVPEVSRMGLDGKDDLRICCDEKLEFDDEENKMLFCEEAEDSCTEQLHEIGQKSSTGGWFVSEGESVLLAHADGSCSFHDIINSEEKAEYKPSAGVSCNMWGDCWLIRAAGSDGFSGRYVVAASAGNTLDSGFCSWDFYTKEICAFHFEGEAVSSSSTTVRARMWNRGVSRSNSLSIHAPNNQHWWYKPCGPLLVSVATGQRAVSVYDIRDGDLVMNWEVPKPVTTMDYSSPLQWRNKGKVVIAQTEGISLWDVNSLSPRPLLSIASSSKKALALHVHNTDAELGGGVRKRVSSTEAEGNDGVFCSPESINVLDFRLPSGVGLKIPKPGSNSQSVFTHGDSIFLGSIDAKSVAKGSPHSRVQQFSLRKGKPVCTYKLPESNTHFEHSSITQVWGSSNLVMGVCGRGLFVYDTLKDERMQSFYIDYANTREVREIIGPDDLYSPSFDYLASRVLLISRDRPALWRYLS